MQLKQKTDSDGMIIRSPNKLHTNKYVRLRTRTDKLVYTIYSKFGICRENDHTNMTAPLPVCSAKLSMFGPG
jgi:hypothetical protein